MADRDGLHVLWIPSWYPTPVTPVNGIFFVEQAQALRAAGARVGIVYPEFLSLRDLRPGALPGRHFQSSYAEEDGIPTYRVHGWNAVPRLVLGGHLWTAIARRLARRYVARHGRPHLVHAHAAMWGGMAARAVAAELGVPYVVTEHFSGFTEHFEGFAPGKITPGQLRAIRGIYAGARRVAVVSSPLGRLLAREGLVDAGKVRVVPNMVRTDFFVPPPGTRPAPPALRVLFVGTLEERKGPHLLLQAFADVLGGRPDAELHLAGTGPMDATLRERVAALGLEGRVRMLGHLGREALREAMWNAHLLALPSYAETFGVVLIEGMSTGLPLLSTECGGPEDIVTPDVGWLVPPGDAPALTDALRRAADAVPGMDPAAIRRSAVERFSPRAVTDGFLRLYDEVLAGSAGAR